MKKNKIAIIGAGNAGCVTALKLLELRASNPNSLIGEIEIYHNPTIPIERVGQGNTINVSSLLFGTLDINWVTNNLIKATVKQGIRYRNWGKKNHDFFHAFLNGYTACHYIPNLLSKTFLESGHFNVIEKNIVDPEKEIDSDYIIDCRGRSLHFDDEYENLTNPINSVILSRKEGKDPDLLYTECIATPHGWTFIIPNHDSVSYGYLYNNKITSKNDAEKDFIQRFNVKPDGHLKFNNYVARNIWRGERTLLNGNRYCFVEPLEATSTNIYYEVADWFDDYLNGEVTKEEMNNEVYDMVKEYAHFILWHYTKGSKFNTPFWDYAQSLPFPEDDYFNSTLQDSLEMSDLELMVESDDKDRMYSQWPPYSIRNWYDNVVK
jgi:hypothetical protein